ncbi:hypothetical protein GF376_05190 [Candidatus Peregrinibacteria bacterium]|nr:hypothetical protein [Candidatus Peregrinibacteria bacterium]
MNQEKTFKLTIRTPDEEIYNGKIKSLKILTEGGWIQVFSNHSTLTGTLSYSPISFIDQNNQEERYVGKRGTLLVSNSMNAVTIILLSCELSSKLSPTNALEYLQFIESELDKKQDLSNFHLEFLEEEKFVIKKEIEELENMGKK